MNINKVLEIHKLPLPRDIIQHHIINFFKPKNYIECVSCNTILPFYNTKHTSNTTRRSIMWHINFQKQQPNNKLTIYCKDCAKKDLKIQNIQV